MPYIIEQCFSDNEQPFASRAQPNPMSPGTAKFSPYSVLRHGAVASSTLTL